MSFDLAIAVAVLGATGVVPTGTLDKVVLIGELTLAGGLRSVPGVLPMVHGRVRAGLPPRCGAEPQAHEASMVPGMEVLGMRSLAQVVAELRGEPVPDAPPVAPMSRQPAAGLAWRRADGRGRPRGPVRDGGRPLRSRGRRRRWPPPPAVRPEGLREDQHRRANPHAAARPGPRGGARAHCRALAGRCPRARRRAADPAAVRGPAPRRVHREPRRRRLRHGPARRDQPGALRRAAPRRVPAVPGRRDQRASPAARERRHQRRARAEESVVLPARSIVVLAANPCPCGDFHVDASLDRCKCREVQRRDYRRKVTGPITDRIDITRHLDRSVTPTAGRDPLAVRESSAAVRARVTAARERQAERYARRGLAAQRPRARPGAGRPMAAVPAATELVDDQLWKGRLTRRGVTRVHRLAWTVADLRRRRPPGDRARSRSRCGCAPASRCWRRRCGGGAG